MQSKISSFFKPPSPPSSSKSDPPPISDYGDDVSLWENTQHQFVNTYKRRAPKSHNREGKVEANKGQVEIRKDHLFSKSSYGKVMNKKRSYAQFHLELGQSDFNLRACRTCGVKYAPGEDEDERKHKVFHRNYTHGVQYKGFKNERVVRMPATDEGRIVLLLNSDPPAQRNKVHEVVKMMEIELGGGWIFHKLCKVYLFISSHRVAGCLVAEPVKEAFKILPCSMDARPDTATTKDSKSDSTTLRFGEIMFQRETKKKVPAVNSLEVLDGNMNGAIVCAEEAAPAICGIRAIWVTPSNRRKHIACQLLDAVRRSFCKGFTLEQSQIAFSPPTSAGKALAIIYTGTASFMVYKPNTADS